jgi:hypothetical protein
MYYPRRDLGCLTAIVQAWALMFTLRHPPATPMSDGRRLAWRIAAAVVCILSLAAGAYFAVVTFRETADWARQTVAMLSFGIFGLPTSLAALLMLGVLAKLGIQSGTMTACTLLIAFLAQWQFLAWSMWQRTRAARERGAEKGPF